MNLLFLSITTSECTPHRSNILSILKNGTVGFWSNASTFLEQSISLEALIAMAALLVAVLIPLAIFLMDNKLNSGFVWDKTVILTKVLNAPKLLISLLLLTTPLLLWKSNNQLKPLLILLFIVGVALLIQAMVRGYKWIRVNEIGYGETYRTSMRLAYLRNLKPEDAKAIWSLTWNDAAGRALIDDRQLVTEFIRQLEELPTKSGSGATMLREFMSYLDKLQLSDPIVYEQILNFSMKWANHLIFDNNEEDVNPIEFRHTARRLFFDVMERSFKDTFLTYMFFHAVQQYLSSTEGANSATFVKRIAPNFFPILEKAGGSHEVWEEFPDEWKISVHTLTHDGKEVPTEWLNGYLHWITSRQLLIGEEDSKYDSFADDVTRNLFTTVELIMWSDLLILHWSPFGSNEGEDLVVAQVRGFLDRDKAFGMISRTTGFVESSRVSEVFNREYKEQQEEVIEMNKLYTIFPNFRSLSKIDEYLKVLNGLSFEVDSPKEGRRLRLIATFERIKSSLPKPKVPKKKST